MSRLQKRAVLDLTAGLLAVAGFLAVLPLLGPWRAPATFALLGFSGLSLFCYWTGRTGRFDAREQLIAREASCFAQRVVLLGLLVLGLVALLLHGADAAVSLRVLTLLAWSAVCGFYLLRSTATLAFSIRH